MSDPAPLESHPQQHAVHGVAFTQSKGAWRWSPICATRE